MKTIRFALMVLVVVGGSALAQPGQTPPDPYPAPPPQPYPQPYPQPQPQPYPQPQPPQGYQVPPPYAYQPQLQLSAEDAALLQQGEITDGQHLGGGIVSLMFGFGVGQAVQGRWSETGWIFTLGEGASIVALIAGAVKSLDNCPLFTSPPSTCGNNNDGEGLLIAGIIGIVVFRTWEVVDAFVGPSKHNTRVRELRMRLGIPQPMYGKRIAPYVNKSRDGGGVAGLSFRF